jgi:hypothetical protein
MMAEETETPACRLPTVIFASSKEQETGIKADIMLEQTLHSNFSSKEE